LRNNFGFIQGRGLPGGECFAYPAIFSKGEPHMRIALTLAALLMVAARVNADDAAKAAKPLPTDDTIINLVGDSLANMFAKCGVPEEIFVNNDKVAILDFGSFAFSVKSKTVTAAFFFKD
jgi:hypothetical protein